MEAACLSQRQSACSAFSNVLLNSSSEIGVKAEEKLQHEVVLVVQSLPGNTCHYLTYTYNEEGCWNTQSHDPNAVCTVI